MAHIDYHVVLEALEQDGTGCPLCGFVQRQEQSYFESMLYSWVGTEGFQDRFLAADGFCSAHAHRFGACHDGVAVAMLYAPLLRHRRQWLRERRQSWIRRVVRRVGTVRNVGPAARGSRANPSDCPLCSQIGTWEHQFLTNLTRHQGDQDLQRAFRAGPGLCLPHYRQLVSRTRRVPSWIARHQDERMDTLHDAVEKFSVGKSGGVGGRNSTAWQDLLEFMEGPPGAIRDTRERGTFRRS